MVLRPKPLVSAPLDDEESAAARRVGKRLLGELEPLIRSLPQQFRGGAAMARELNIDRSTCQRVVHAVRQSTDELDALVRVPGVEGLQRFTAALDKRGTPKPLLKAANEAFDAFAQLIDRLAGSQAALIRRIQVVCRTPHGGLTDEAQAALREQAFEALGPLTGRQLEKQCNFLLIRPVPDNPSQAELIGARDLIGLSGGAGAPPVSGIFFSRADESLPEGQPRPVPLASDSEGESQLEGSTVIREFCSQANPKVVTRQVGDVSLELIDPPGKDHDPIDVALAYRLSHPILHPALQDNRLLHCHYHCVVPTRRVMLYAYLHRSMARHCLVQTFVHQRSAESLPDHADPWFDRLDQHLVVEILGSDLSAARAGASPRQEELLTHVFQRAGWPPNEFIGYRVILEHPIWGCRYTVAFEFSELGHQG